MRNYGHVVTFFYLFKEFLLVVVIEGRVPGEKHITDNSSAPYIDLNAIGISSEDFWRDIAWSTAGYFMRFEVADMFCKPEVSDLHTRIVKL